MNLVAGDYQLTVQGQSESVLGNYQFRLLNLQSATPLVAGNVTSGTLSPANSTVIYSFNATEGERFYFDSQTTSPANAAWRLVDPFGRPITHTGLGNDLGTQSLPLTGVYWVLVEGNLNDTDAVS